MKKTNRENIWGNSLAHTALRFLFGAERETPPSILLSKHLTNKSMRWWRLRFSLIGLWWNSSLVIQYIFGGPALCAHSINMIQKGPGMTFDELESNKGSAANRCRCGRFLVTACRLTAPGMPLDIITRAGRVRRRRVLRKHHSYWPVITWLSLMLHEREACFMDHRCLPLSRLCKHSQRTAGPE